MTISIEIIKTADGYKFHDTGSLKLVGTIHESKNRDYAYFWESFGEIGKRTPDQAMKELKNILIRRASNLGCKIRFIFSDTG